MVTYDNISVPEALKIEEQLKRRLQVRAIPANIRTVAGADLAFDKSTNTIYASIVTLSFPQLKPVAHSLARAEVKFPYMPGFLSFREVPVLVKAWKQMLEKPDVIIVDGHGIAHPRNLGIASHFGVITKQATIGCAKKIFYGNYEEPGAKVHENSVIYNNKGGMIGHALRTREDGNPVFVSPGYKTDFEGSLELVRKCGAGYRLPEPTRVAYYLVSLFKSGKLSEGYHFSGPAVM